MPPKAQVRSLDAIDSFRASLAIYVSQARAALDEVTSDITRTRGWIENDQRLHWERELRARNRTLEQAQQELFSARLSSLRTESGLEQMAVHRARRAVEQAEDKLRLLKKWEREFDSRVQPLVKESEKLHTVLSNDLVKGIAFLHEIGRSLAAYAEVGGPGTTGSAPAAVPPAATGENGEKTTA
jgi:hypothetical protein